MTSRGSTRQKGLFLIPVTFTFSLEHSFPVVPGDGRWMLDPCRVAVLLACAVSAYHAALLCDSFLKSEGWSHPSFQVWKLSFRRPKA